MRGWYQSNPHQYAKQRARTSDAQEGWTDEKWESERARARMRTADRIARKNEAGLSSARPKKTARPQLHDRQGGMCAHCGLPLDATAEAHHVVRVEDGGTHDLDNLRLVHRECHTEIHKRERAAKWAAEGQLGTRRVSF